MTDQVTSPEAGAQPQDTTPEVENLEMMEQSERTEVQDPGPPEQQQTPPKTVPLAALHEERAKRRELQERQRVMEDRFNKLSDVVNQRFAPQPQQEQRAEIPDINVDAVGHFKAQNDQLRQQLEQIGRPVQEIQQRMAQQEQYQRIQTHVGSQISEFAKEKPDVQQAIQHAQQADYQALKALGYEDAQARQMVTQQYDNTVIQLIQQGRNVAESMYAFAQSKGYQAKAADTTGQEKLQATQQRVGAARSLGGGSAGTKLSLASLADMPAEEFAKTIGDEAAWRKLWGG